MKYVIRWVAVIAILIMCVLGVRSLFVKNVEYVEKEVPVPIEVQTPIYIDTLSVKMDSMVAITSRLRLELMQAKKSHRDSTKASEKAIRQLHDSIATLRYNEWRKDIIELNLPKISRNYKTSDYDVVVTGVVDPQLSTIKIAEKSAKRWHVGPCVGYGFDGRNGSAFIGVSVVYSLYSW